MIFFTMNKLHELSSRITDEFPNIICIAEVKPKNFKRTLSLVECNIVGYNTKALNIVQDTGRRMLLFIKKDIKYKLVDTSLFTDSLPQEVIACQVVTNNGNSLIIACVFRSPNSTADNTNSLNQTLRALAKRYYSNLVVLGDFNYPKIDWTHCTTTTNTNDPNFMFLETIRDCFLQQYVKSPTRGRNCDNPSLIDLALCNNDDLVLDVSVLSPLGKSDHSLIEMQVRCDINVDLKTYYYDYKNANFDMIRSVFNNDFNSQLNDLSDVNDQVCLLLNTLNEALSQYVPIKECNFTNTAPVKLNGTAKSKKLRQKQRLWKQYIKTNDTSTYVKFRKVSN